MVGGETDRLHTNHAERTDVTSKQSVENVLTETVREFGTVDILVNNVVLFADLPVRSFQDITEEE